jgi:2-polyprenyl-6-methoxyphenol hydroxylase-like FAD-dependent oxidoreductase
MTMPQRIAIIGGGPGGLMLARLLQRGGLAVTVFERDRDPQDRPQGGSLDLHEDTGLAAIRLAGLDAPFAAAARPEDQGDRLYDAQGTLLFDRDGAGGNRPEIDRSALRQILLDSLMPGSLRWGMKVDGIEAGSHGFAVSAQGVAQDFDIVVGADGAWSRVRPLLSPAVPLYEGVVFVEMGFDAAADPQVAALTGAGKMFAVGNQRALITQRNGQGRIRGYAGWRLPQAEAEALRDLPASVLRATLHEVFSGWAPSLHPVVERGEILAVRPLYALPVDHAWTPRMGVTCLGDAAHLMSPFSGEGVNLALADAVGLATALASGEGWEAVARHEAAMMQRARPEAAGARTAGEMIFSPGGAMNLLAHYKDRVGARRGD